MFTEAKRVTVAAVSGLIVVPALVASVSLPTMGSAAIAHADNAVSQVKSVHISKVSKSSCKVTWKKAPSKKVTGYQVKVYKSGKAVKTYTVKGRSKTSKSVTGLKSGTKYTAKVRAYSGSGSKNYGAWSSAKSVTTSKASKSSASKSKGKTHKVGKTVYITKSGKKYHVSGCSSLRRSKIAISLSTAKSRGYSPCHNCI